MQDPSDSLEDVSGVASSYSDKDPSAPKAIQKSSEILSTGDALTGNVYKMHPIDPGQSISVRYCESLRDEKDSSRSVTEY